jgi:TatD DNase family protein
LVTRLVDTHCHLTVAAFDADRGQVVERARAAGLVGCVVVALDAPTARQALALADDLPGWAFPSAGVHPTEDVVADEAEWARIAELLASNRFVAVGETGLDDFHHKVPLELQVRSLHRHVAAALDLGLPLILHCRDAFPRLLDELRRYEGAPLRGVLHCFTGGAQEAARLLALGLHLGLGGVTTYKANAALRDVVREAPLERLLLETDAPWLAPQPERGRRNEPAFVTHVAQRLAADRGLALDDFAACTTANADALFGLGLARDAVPTPRRPWA